MKTINKLWGSLITKSIISKILADYSHNSQVRMHYQAGQSLQYCMLHFQNHFETWLYNLHLQITQKNAGNVTRVSTVIWFSVVKKHT